MPYFLNMKPRHVAVIIFHLILYRHSPGHSLDTSIISFHYSNPNIWQIPFHQAYKYKEYKSLISEDGAAGIIYFIFPINQYK